MPAVLQAGQDWQLQRCMPAADTRNCHFQTHLNHAAHVVLLYLQIKMVPVLAGMLCMLQALSQCMQCRHTTRVPQDDSF